MITRLQHIGVLLIITLSGCDKSLNHSNTANTLPVQHSDIVATVNNETISTQELHHAINRMFSTLDQLHINDELRTKVLDSLIAAKIMQQSIKTQLSEEELSQIHQKVIAYEQELYVKKYLAHHVTPQPVTSQMVKTYYDNNPTEFGATTFRTFESLIAKKTPSEQQRDALMEQANTIINDKNWQASAESLKKRYGLLYQQAHVVPDIIEPRLKAIIDQLAIGESSGVNFIEGKPVIVRITGEKNLPAKPLNEVSSQIRKRLAPMQLRKAVKETTTKLLAAATIVKQ